MDRIIQTANTTPSARQFGGNARVRGGSGSCGSSSSSSSSSGFGTRCRRRGGRGKRLCRVDRIQPVEFSQEAVKLIPGESLFTAVKTIFTHIPSSYSLKTESAVPAGIRASCREFRTHARAKGQKQQKRATRDPLLPCNTQDNTSPAGEFPGELSPHQGRGPTLMVALDIRRPDLAVGASVGACTRPCCRQKPTWKSARGGVFSYHPYDEIHASYIRGVLRLWEPFVLPKYSRLMGLLHLGTLTQYRSCLHFFFVGVDLVGPMGSTAHRVKGAVFFNRFAGLRHK